MGKVKGKHRLDKYYRLAKERGFRSRASYKLLQLNDKYNLLHSSTTVLDLCAAPGGWMQVAVEKAPVGSFVLGIDLVPISPIRGCVAIQQDITRTNECKSKIKQVMEKHGLVNVAFDLVMHDGSPNVGGAWDQEAMSQNALVIDSLKLATELLAPRGNFITKVFRSRDYNSVLFCLKKLFAKVEVFKPLASRSQSAETYLIGLNYKAPAKIDPRLLDFRHLFKEAPEPTRKVVDVLGGSKQKRHRGGYENGESILRKVASAADFVKSENPLEMLGRVTCISFDDDQASLSLKEHDLTTDEIKILCDDLLVLGKNDFKNILKWRNQIKKALTRTKKEDEDDAKLLNKLEEMTNTIDSKKKRSGDSKDTSSDIDSDEELQRYTDQMEKVFDDAYDRYMMMKKQGISGAKQKRVKLSLDSDRVDDHYDSDEATNPLVVPVDGETQTTKEEVGHPKTLDDTWEEEDEVPSEKPGKSKEKESKDDFEIVPALATDSNSGSFSDDELNDDFEIVPALATDSDSGSFSDDELNDDFEIVPALATDSDSGSFSDDELKDDFEIVPAPATDSDSESSSDDDDDENVLTKAEILPCTKKMLRKKQRQEMFDYAYNKYMFEEDEEALLLTKRFSDEETKHREQAMKMKPKRVDGRMKSNARKKDNKSKRKFCGFQV